MFFFKRSAVAVIKWCSHISIGWQMKSCNKMAYETNMTTILFGKVRLTRNEGSLSQWSWRLPTGTLWKGVVEWRCPLGLEDEVLYRMALAFSVSLGLIGWQPWVCLSVRNIQGENDFAHCNMCVWTKLQSMVESNPDATFLSLKLQSG